MVVRWTAVYKPRCMIRDDRKEAGVQLMFVCRRHDVQRIRSRASIADCKRHAMLWLAGIAAHTSTSVVLHE